MEIERQTWRTISRWTFFLLTFVGLPVYFLKFFTYGTWDWFDPFFSIQTIVIYLARGEVPPTGALTLIIATVGGITLFTLWRGRAFCSWVCPFGTLLSFTGKLGDLLLKSKRELPEVMRDRTLKYGILIGFLFSAAVLGQYVFCSICPAGTFARGAGPLSIYGIPALFYIPIFVLVFILILAFFYDARAWCKYLCPLGAYLAIVDQFGPHSNRVALPNEECLECKKCEEVCPMAIHTLDYTRYPLLNDPEVKAALVEVEKPDLFSRPAIFARLPEPVKNALQKNKDKYRIDTRECIRCYECVDVCPLMIRRHKAEVAAKLAEKEKKKAERAKKTPAVAASPEE